MFRSHDLIETALMSDHPSEAGTATLAMSHDRTVQVSAQFGMKQSPVDSIGYSNYPLDLGQVIIIRMIPETVGHAHWRPPNR